MGGPASPRAASDLAPSPAGRGSSRSEGVRGAAGRITLPSDQPVRIRREKRRGKWTTVVAGLDPAATDLPALLKRFQKSSAAGGTLREDGFELQGDHRDRLLADLKALGYSAAKAAGG